VIIAGENLFLPTSHPAPAAGYSLLMPLLTRDNLDELGRRTRRYRCGVETPPTTADELRAIPRPQGNRSVWLMVFGPAGSYRVLFAVGLEDYELRESISQNVKGVRTIEDQLRKALTDYPPERGHDLIVVPLPVGVDDKWAFAERTDEHARRCLAKVKRVFG
jgi:hypothetical protein